MKITKMKIRNTNHTVIEYMRKYLYEIRKKNMSIHTNALTRLTRCGQMELLPHVGMPHTST